MAMCLRSVRVRFRVLGDCKPSCNYFIDGALPEDTERLVDIVVSVQPGAEVLRNSVRYVGTMRRIRRQHSNMPSAEQHYACNQVSHSARNNNSAL